MPYATNESQHRQPNIGLFLAINSYAMPYVRRLCVLCRLFLGGCNSHSDINLSLTNGISSHSFWYFGEGGRQAKHMTSKKFMVPVFLWDLLAIAVIGYGLYYCQTLTGIFMMGFVVSTTIHHILHWLIHLRD